MVRGLSRAGRRGRQPKADRRPDDVRPAVRREGTRLDAFLGEGSIDSLAEEDIRSPVAKYFSVDQAKEMARIAGAKRGDMLLMVADRPSVANSALDALRRELASRLELYDPNVLAFAFVKEYPLLEWSDTEERWMSVHHPFTSPYLDDLEFITSDSGRVRSHAYDLVCNGWELFSGSIRIHRRDVQEKMFSVLGISRGRGEAQVWAHAGGVRIRRAAARRHRRRY